MTDIYTYRVDVFTSEPVDITGFEVEATDGHIGKVDEATYDAGASCLVVDTGLHTMGWTRQQAIDCMRAHAPVNREEIVVEVDRYIGMPGQALAYTVGQREILRLRDEARGALGPDFDIKAFHDAVLGAATISLRVLRDRVRSSYER